MMFRALMAGAALAVCPIVATAQATTGLNPVYRRAQAMVNDGNAAAGRALIDSMISVAAPGSSDYAEAVYWRAVLSATAAEAETDYRRIVVEFPQSPRVADALIRLAQLEIARANYDGAVQHLNKLIAEHPESPARPRANYWLARALFDKNDIQNGCVALADALARTTENEAELRNQITYLNQRCAGVALAGPVPVSPTAPAASSPATVTIPPRETAVASVPVNPVADSVPLAVRSAARPAAPAPRPAVQPRPVETTAEAEPPAPAASEGRSFSVQVAAYNVKSQAEAMVT